MASAGPASGAWPWQVPRFGGLAFATYRIVWLLLMAAALASLAWLDPRLETQTIDQVKASTSFGFLTYGEPAAEGAFGQAFDDEARRAGVRPGDNLLRVGGRAVPGTMVGNTRVMAGPPGSVAVLTLRHGDGRLYTLRVARDPSRLNRAYAGSGITFEGRRWFAFAVRTLAGMLSLVAAALLFVRRPRDPVAQLLSFSLVLGRATLPALLPSSLAVLEAAQPLLAGVMLTLAVLLFPGRRFTTRWHWLAFAAACSSAAAQLVMYSVSWFPFWATTALALPFALLLVAVARQLQLTPPGVERQQAKFVLFGVVVFTLLLIASYLLAQMQLAITSPGVNAWAILGTQCSEALAGIAIPAGLLVSLLRYRLYDADATISRSVSYGALTVALLGVFAGSEKVIELIGERYFGGSLGSLAGVIGAAAAAVAIGPLHGRVTHWAAKRFRGGLVRLREELPQLVGDLRETATPVAIADAVLARVEGGVRASHGAVVTGGALLSARDLAPQLAQEWLSRGLLPADATERLDCDRGDPLFPVRLSLHADGVGQVGWLLLGPRPDGSFYGREERAALHEIADPIVRALAIALERTRREDERRRVDAQRQARDEARDREIGRLGRAVEQLQQRLGVTVPAGGAMA